MSGLATYSLKLTVELIRMQVFYIRGEYDVSSFFQQHVDIEGTTAASAAASAGGGGSSSSTATPSIKEDMLRATIVLAKALRRLNARQWDETASAIIRHSQGILTTSANYDRSGSSGNDTTNNGSSSSGQNNSSIHAVNEILNNFYLQVQQEA